MNQIKPLFNKLMKKGLCILYLLGLLGGLGFPEKTLASSTSFIAEVVAVLEGDRMKVMKTRQIMLVRLHGVDAPEITQQYGEQAKNFTESIAFGEKVVINIKGPNQQDHLVAEIIMEDGRSLNRELVKAGFAWWARSLSDDLSLWRLENKARQEKRGLWLGEEPVPPWEFRSGTENP